MALVRNNALPRTPTLPAWASHQSRNTKPTSASHLFLLHLADHRRRHNVRRAVWRSARHERHLNRHHCRGHPQAPRLRRGHRRHGGRHRCRRRSHGHSHRRWGHGHDSALRRRNRSLCLSAICQRCAWECNYFEQRRMLGPGKPHLRDKSVSRGHPGPTNRVYVGSATDPMRCAFW